MHILLTNDDGFAHAGLQALTAAVAGLGQVTVIAPTREWSNSSHAVTTHAPLSVIEHAADRFAVNGSPADCVRLGLAVIAPDTSWVISGINPGGNLGTDVVHSGTVAAAREAALRGIRSIAVSHFIRRGIAIRWDEAQQRAADVIRQLLQEPPPSGSFWNVNLPHLESADAAPSVVRCELDPSPLPLKFTSSAEGHIYAGNYHARERRPGYDIDVCFNGQIAVSLVAAL